MISLIGNSTYDFNFSLIKYRKEGSTIIPINKGNIKYLEIENNLINFGYTGVVVFANFVGILDRLGLGGGINDETILFDVNIKNLDWLKKVELPVSDIQAIFQLHQNTELNSDSIERSMLFKFEEFAVSLLKQKKAESLPVTGNTVSNIIKEYLIKGLSNNLIKEDEFIHNDVLVNTSHIAAEDYSSYYDIILSLYKYLFYENKKSPGILQLKDFTKSEQFISRKFVAYPLFDFINKFTEKIKIGDKNLQDYVLEVFREGGEDTKAITIPNNAIKEYSLFRPDYNSLLSEKWVNYKTTTPNSSDITNVSTQSLRYEDFKNEFEVAALNGYSSNLPNRSELDNKNQIVTRSITNEGLPGLISITPGLLESGIKNLIYKSFIFDNSAIVFTVLGNPYRKPGTFIAINTDVDTKTDLSSSVQGYWFVIGVKHIFQHEIYTNEITAVKLFINDSSVQQTVRVENITPVTPPAVIIPDAVPDTTPNDDGDYVVIPPDIQLPTTSEESVGPFTPLIPFGPDGPNIEPQSVPEEDEKPTAGAVQAPLT